MLIDMDQIIEDIRKNPMLRGVTFSGGDPWEQADKFSYIARAVKSLGLSIWCYTGYTFEYILENIYKREGWNELLKYVDVLVDGPFDETRTGAELKYRGSSNQRIIDVQASLETLGAVALDLNN
jgi:anaerobic ribonucleoside-triphosphate reductase activating protein